MKVHYQPEYRTLLIIINPDKQGWYHETYEGLKSCDTLTISRAKDDSIVYIGLDAIADEIILSEIPNCVRDIVRQVFDEKRWRYRAW